MLADTHQTKTAQLHPVQVRYENHHQYRWRRSTDQCWCGAQAIGPQDVLVTLLNNLKVQERQNRVCTTVAIAIVAETCSPFTVLPALMNEYKVRPLPFLSKAHDALAGLLQLVQSQDTLHGGSFQRLVSLSCSWPVLTVFDGRSAIVLAMLLECRGAAGYRSYHGPPPWECK